MKYIRDLAKADDRVMSVSPQIGKEKYVSLLNDQLDWCNENQEAIIRKAEKLYRLITENPDKLPLLTKRCCDFIRLETVLSTRY